jgi:hypothetical protein
MHAEMSDSSTIKTAIVRLSREPGSSDRLRAYKVLLDGSMIGKIRDGQTTELSVGPGPHNLRLKLGWGGSPDLTVEVGAGELADFVCRSGAATPGMAFYYSLFRRNRLVDLRRVEERLPPAGDWVADAAIRVAIIVPSIFVWAGISVWMLPELGVPGGWANAVIYGGVAAAIVSVGMTVRLPPIGRAKRKPPEW